MNARTESFDLTVEPHQVEESVLSVFHTVLVHRTLGKFTYQQENFFCIGSIGTRDIDCQAIDLTYVRVNNDELSQSLRHDVLTFREGLRQKDGSFKSGKISMEFFQRSKGTWGLTQGSAAWEIWTLNIDIAQPSPDSDSQKLSRELAGESTSEVILGLCGMMNSGEFIPKMPSQSELSSVFDTHYRDIQPYLFRVTHQATGPSSGLSVTSTVKKLIKDSLSM